MPNPANMSRERKAALAAQAAASRSRIGGLTAGSGKKLGRCPTLKSILDCLDLTCVVVGRWRA